LGRLFVTAQAGLIRVYFLKKSQNVGSQPFSSTTLTKWILAAMAGKKLAL